MPMHFTKGGFISYRWQWENIRPCPPAGSEQTFLFGQSGAVGATLFNNVCIQCMRQVAEKCILGSQLYKWSRVFESLLDSSYANKCSFNNTWAALGRGLASTGVRDHWV